MAERSIDGVDVKEATPRQLESYKVVDEQLDAFRVPKLYDSADPNARVFLALFDGTGNDAIKDPQHTTNIGLLARQVVQVSAENPNVGYFYKEGIGTQGGLVGVLDAATGGTYAERIEDMYDKFDVQAARWLKENPEAKISVISIGFSRGAEQAAGFSRLVDERGIQDPTSKISELFGNGIHDVNTYAAPPLRPGGTIPQAVGLYDPVASGEPSLNDRRLPPTVLSGMQITAANEYRSLFPSTSIIKQGVSDDGRFLGVTTAGCHSDIGGGYELNGLSHRNFNLMSKYVNSVLGEPVVKVLEVPPEPSKSVIHDSSQHKWFYSSLTTRGVDDRLEPSGTKPYEPADPRLKQEFFRNVYIKTAASEKVFQHEKIGSTLSETEFNLVAPKLGGLDKAVIIVPETNSLYSGKIIQVSDTHIIQKTGVNTAVSHDVSKLTNGKDIQAQAVRGWPKGKELDIIYGNNSGRATILELKKSNVIPAPPKPVNALKVEKVVSR